MSKPVVNLSGDNGNVFNILGKCTKALKRNNQEKEAKELSEKVFSCNSYDEALRLCMEYVDVN